MKKSYLIAFILSSFLSASTDLDEALKLFNSGDFQNSYPLLQKLSESGSTANDLDFYLGRSAFEVGKYNEALFAFDRVLIEVDENNRAKVNRVKLELARTHLALGERESAKELFSEVLAENPPQIVKDKIHSILEESKKSKKKSYKWNFFANLETGYEENINSQPSVDSMRDYVNNPDIKPDSEIDSLYLQEMGGVGFSYLFGESSFSINSNLFAFNQNYFEDGDYDITYFALGVSPIYKMDSNRFEIPIKVENVNYGGENLLDTASIGFKASRYIETQYIKAIVFDIFTNYKLKDYESSRNDQDSNIFEYGLSAKIKYKENLLSLRYSTENESSKNDPTPNSNQTDKIINSIKIKYDRENIAGMFNLSLLYLFRNIVYDDYEAFESLNPNVSDGTRKDRYHSFRVGLSKEVMKNLYLDLGFNHIISNSNHTPIEYDKNIMSFGASYSF